MANVKETLIEEKLVKEYTSIDIDQEYDDFLDDTYPIEIGNITFNASRVLAELDPIAYRCGIDDYVNSMEYVDVDGEYFSQADYDEAKEELVDELAELQDSLEEYKDRLDEINEELEEEEDETIIAELKREYEEIENTLIPDIENRIEELEE